MNPIKVGSKVITRRRFSHGEFSVYTGQTVIKDASIVEEGTTGVVTYVDKKSGDMRLKCDGYENEQWVLGSTTWEELTHVREENKPKHRQSLIFKDRPIDRTVFMNYIRKERSFAIKNAAHHAIFAAKFAIQVSVEASSVIVSHTKKLLEACPEFSSVGLMELNFAQVVRLSFSKQHTHTTTTTTTNTQVQIQDMTKVSILDSRKETRTAPCLKLQCKVKPQHEDQGGGYTSLASRMNKKFSKLTSWSRMSLEYDIQNKKPPSRIKSWFDSRAASGKWEKQFEKKTLMFSSIQSHRAEMSKRVAKDVDLDKFDHISKDRDRENALIECANELRVTMASADLMFETPTQVIEEFEFQLSVVTSKLLKLVLSKILKTENCVKKIFQTSAPNTHVHVKISGDSSREWRRGVVTSASNDDNDENLGVKIKGWPMIKKCSPKDVLIDGVWLNGLVEHVNINKYVLRHNLNIFAGLQYSSNSFIRECCASVGILRSKKACEWDLLGFCDWGLRPLIIRVDDDIRYMSDLRHVLDREVAVFNNSSSSSSSDSNDDKIFQQKLRLATDLETHFQISLFFKQLKVLHDLIKTEKNKTYFVKKCDYDEKENEDDEDDEYSFLTTQQRRALEQDQKKDVDFWSFTNFRLYGESEQDLDDIERVVSNVKNYRTCIKELEHYISRNDEEDENRKQIVIDVLEDMIESNMFNEDLKRVGINTSGHIQKSDVNVDICKRLVNSLRDTIHMRFHTRRAEMLSRIACNMKPSLAFTPLNNAQPVWALATSLDGSIIATAGASGEIKIWIRVLGHVVHNDGDDDDEDEYNDDDDDDDDDDCESVCVDDLDILEWKLSSFKNTTMWQNVSSERVIHAHNDWKEHQKLVDAYVFFFFYFTSHTMNLHDDDDDDDTDIPYFREDIKCVFGH
jgi:hypothetical protein